MLNATYYDVCRLQLSGLCLIVDKHWPQNPPLICDLPFLQPERFCFVFLIVLHKEGGAKFSLSDCGLKFSTFVDHAPTVQDFCVRVCSPICACVSVVVDNLPLVSDVFSPSNFSSPENQKPPTLHNIGLHQGARGGEGNILQGSTLSSSSLCALFIHSNPVPNFLKNEWQQDQHFWGKKSFYFISGFYVYRLPKYCCSIKKK